MKKIFFLVLIVLMSSCAKEDRGAKSEPDVMDLPGISEETKKEIVVKT